MDMTDGAKPTAPTRAAWFGGFSVGLGMAEEHEGVSSGDSVAPGTVGELHGELSKVGQLMVAGVG